MLKHCTNLADILEEVANHGFTHELPEELIVTKELQVCVQIHAARKHQKDHGIEDLLKREKELLLWSHAIEGSISDICLKNYKVFGDGLQNLSDINASVEHAHDRVHGFRAELTRIRQQTVAKAKEIYRKQEIIGRMKLTMDRLSMLRTTFGQLALQLARFTNQGQVGAYTVIPLMKAAQLNIQRFNVTSKSIPKLQDLSLACMQTSANYFERQIDFIKETVARGIDACYGQFNDQKYFSYLQSYYYLEKFYEMPPIEKQIWGSIKRAIDQCLLDAFTEFERQANMTFYVGEQTTLVERLIQVPKDQSTTFIKGLYGKVVDLLLNFHLCNRFHYNNNQPDVEFIDEEEFNRYMEVLCQQYLTLRAKIWAQVQRKLAKVLNAYQQLNFVSMEEFVLMLGCSCLLIKRAEDYSQSDSRILCGCLENRVLEYIAQLHKHNVKSVLTYVNNEEFRRLPVANDAKLTQILRDLQGKKQYVNRELFSFLESERRVSESPDAKKHIDMMQLLENESETQQFYLYGFQNPFRLDQEEFKLVQAAIWTQAESPHIKSDIDMVLTATSLKIYQMLGPYITLSFYVPNVSEAIFLKYFQLIKLYVYFSYRLLISLPYATQMEEPSQPVLKFDENKDIEPYLAQYDQLSETCIVKDRNRMLRLFIEEMRETTDARDVDTFSKERKEFADITERALAIESTRFLVLSVQQGYTTALTGINQDHRAEHITKEITLMRNLMVSFSRVLYQSYMLQHIKIEGITTSVVQLKWDIKEAPPQLNTYSDRLIRFLCDQREKLKSLGGGVITATGQRDIFEALVEYCTTLLIEAYGRVKKVSPTGRDQMINELRTITQAIATSNPDAQMPSILISKADQYLQAFRFPLEDVWGFIHENMKFFPFRMMVNLLFICISFTNLKKSQKKEEINRIYRLYYDFFNASN